MEEEDAPQSIEEYFFQMIQHQASDLYLTVGAPPTYRVGDKLVSGNNSLLTRQNIMDIIQNLLSETQRQLFEETLEFNLLHQYEKIRYRINFFFQQQLPGIVIRQINMDVPTVESLHLDPIYGEIALQKSGLIILASPSGSGKSTSLAAMLEHRNQHKEGHVLTIEDPIEYAFENKKCIFTQREINTDTLSYQNALKNAARQRADVVMIGEVRDRETMEMAIHFAEAGHLCMLTLLANNTYNALERILHFFPDESHDHVCNVLSQSLLAIICQKLVPTTDGAQKLVIEYLKNTSSAKSLLIEKRLLDIKEYMDGDHGKDTRSYDQSLFELLREGIITEQTAMAEAENESALRLKIMQHQKATKSETTLPKIEEAPKADDSEKKSDF